MHFQPKIPKNLDLVSSCTKPAFVHDCSECHFLGTFEGAVGLVDLYAHNAVEPTVIARFSSEGPDYASGSCFSYGQNNELTEARWRAQLLGLWTYDVYEALHYAKSEYPEAYREMLRALPFTLEYQALLAFEKGDMVRSQTLIRHLFASALAEVQTFESSAHPFVVCIEVRSRIEQIAKTYRNLNRWDTEVAGSIIGFLQTEILSESRQQKYNSD